MECSKVSLARSRADMEDQTSIKSYPLPVAVWIIRQLVEELVSFRRRASNLLVEWHGMACSPAAPNKGRVLAFWWFLFANSKALLG
jgi:hypothetical protein